MRRLLFLATLLLAKLVADGKMTWETPVTSLLPSFKLGDAATTRQVLTSVCRPRSWGSAMTKARSTSRGGGRTSSCSSMAATCASGISAGTGMSHCAGITRRSE
mgnify:CR=1 FL=1